MDEEGDDKDDTKRRSRNLSEKKRRDQFNMLVNELSTMVSANNRKMDKSTVLKSTIAFLKSHKEAALKSKAHDVQNDWKPTFLTNEEFTHLVLEALEGFIIVFSTTGRIYYVSEGVTSLLNLFPVDIINKSIFDFAHDEDRPHIYNLLQNPVVTGNSNQSYTAKSSLTENQIHFQCHILKGRLGFRDTNEYERIYFSGYFRPKKESAKSIEAPIYSKDNNTSLLFVCAARLHTPLLMKDASLLDPSRNEFTSRHSLEWKFLFLDHRAPPIIGYLPFEVLGTSGYDYYHFDDLEKVVACHEALMQKGELTSCYYRFLTKGQQWIWLQTRYFITYHQWNSKPEFVVCTHRVISYSDLAKSVKTEETESQKPNTQQNPATQDSSKSQRTQGDRSPSYISESYGTEYTYLSQTRSMKSEKNSQRRVSTNVAGGEVSNAQRRHPRSVACSESESGAGSMAGSVTGSVAGSAHGSVPCSVAGSVQSSVAGSVQGSVAGSVQGSVAGSVQGSVAGSVQGSVAGSVQGSVAGSVQGSVAGSVQGSVAGSVQGSVTGSVQGSVQGNVSGSVQESATGSVVGSAVENAEAAQAQAQAQAEASWAREARARYAGFDAVPVSTDSRSTRSRRSRNADAMSTCSAGTNSTGGGEAGALEGHVPQAPPPPQVPGQYLEPSYMTTVGVRGVMPVTLPPLSVIVTPAQAHLQDQLQRKHEELQHMIMQQQEELRRVAEQLMMARLGLLSPVLTTMQQEPLTYGGGALPAMEYSSQPPLIYEHMHLEPPQHMPGLTFPGPNPPPPPPHMPD